MLDPAPCLLVIIFATLASTRVEDNLGQAQIRLYSAPKSFRAETEFKLALAALHSFEYPLALVHFENVIRLERDFLLGYWGAAMSCWQPVWMSSDSSSARIFLQRAPKEAFGKNSAYSILLYNATVALFSPSSGKENIDVEAYLHLMRFAVVKFPTDVESKAFLALGILAKILPEFRGFVDRGSILLPELNIHLNAGLKLSPNHPGLFWCASMTVFLPSIRHFFFSFPYMFSRNI